MFAVAEVANNRLRLLELLAKNEGSIVSLTVLSDELEISCEAVYKLVVALRGEGLAIEIQPQKGYILHDHSKTDMLSQTYINLLLKRDPIFHTCLCFSVVTSTQHIIKNLARKGTPEGVVAVCDEQTEGRGRQGRTWNAQRGTSLMFSVLLRPHICLGEVPLLNLAAGVAVRNVLAGEYGVGAELKWPNDILIGRRKICGILSESAGNTDKVFYAAIGIGINVNCAADDFPDEIRGRATSVFMETGKKTPRPALLAKVLKEFAGVITLLNRPGGKERLLSIYRSVCVTLGREVRIVSDGAEIICRATGVTEQGALIAVIDGTEKIFAAAEVFHLRMK